MVRCVDIVLRLGFLYEVAVSKLPSSVVIRDEVIMNIQHQNVLVILNIPPDGVRLYARSTN